MDKNSLERYFSPQQVRDRRREKARERQRRRRKARKEQLEQQRKQDSSDEEFSLGFLQQTDQEHTPAPSGHQWDRLYRREYEACKKKRSRRQLQLEDAAAQSPQNELTTTAEEEDNEKGAEEEEDSEHIVEEIGSQRVEDEGLEKLAKEFALIKCSSYVSDSAMEKLFSMFMENAPLILSLHNAGRISNSYLNTIKPTALQDVPTIM